MSKRLSKISRTRPSQPDALRFLPSSPDGRVSIQGIHPGYSGYPIHPLADSPNNNKKLYDFVSSPRFLNPLVKSLLDRCDYCVNSRRLRLSVRAFVAQNRQFTRPRSFLYSLTLRWLLYNPLVWYIVWWCIIQRIVQYMTQVI